MLGVLSDKALQVHYAWLSKWENLGNGSQAFLRQARQRLPPEVKAEGWASSLGLGLYLPGKSNLSVKLICMFN